MDKMNDIKTNVYKNTHLLFLMNSFQIKKMIKMFLDLEYLESIFFVHLSAVDWMSTSRKIVSWPVQLQLKKLKECKTKA